MLEVDFGTLELDVPFICQEQSHTYTNTHTDIYTHMHRYTEVKELVSGLEEVLSYNYFTRSQLNL